MTKYKLKNKPGTFLSLTFLAVIFLFLYIIFSYDSSHVGSYYFNLIAYVSASAFFLATLFVLYRGMNNKKILRQKIEDFLLLIFVIVFFSIYAKGAWSFLLDLPFALSSNYSSIEGTLKELKPGRYNENFSVNDIQFSVRRKANFNDFYFGADSYRVIYLPKSKFVIDIIPIKR